VLTETAIGRLVNVETDILGKYVQRLLSFGPSERGARGVDLAFLTEHGFRR
jgi:riboflavin synthase alpha subunit